MASVDRLLKVGVDLDNTLADYRRPLEKLCAAYGIVGEYTDPKIALRGELHRTGREEEWTRLQGELYGPLMGQAEPFAGAVEGVLGLRAAGFDVVIISHRTKHPFLGKRHDLHAAARGWLAENGLGEISLFMEENQGAKVARMASEGCQVFVDDLPEILRHVEFPKLTRKILFDPGASHIGVSEMERASSWSEVLGLIGI